MAMSRDSRIKIFMRSFLTAICRGFQYEAGVVLENRQLDAFHGRSAELRAILLIIPSDELSQVDRPGGKSRPKCRIGRVGSAFVPWTDILADIAAVEPFANCGGSC